MDRRSALKQAALIAGGIAWLPACDFGPQRVAVALNNLQLNDDHQELLAKVAATIIPSSDEIPGAEELDLYRFILVMVDDCEDEPTQSAFSRGLAQLSSFSKQHLEKSFPQKEQPENEQLLTQLLAMDADALPSSPDAGSAEAVDQPSQLEAIQTFLGITKRYAVQGYMVSEYFMTEQFPYKLVPGKFQACVSTEGLTVM